jgi:hypothetical protein
MRGDYSAELRAGRTALASACFGPRMANRSKMNAINSKKATKSKITTDPTAIAQTEMWPPYSAAGGSANSTMKSTKGMYNPNAADSSPSKPPSTRNIMLRTEKSFGERYLPHFNGYLKSDQLLESLCCVRSNSARPHYFTNASASLLSDGSARDQTLRPSGEGEYDSGMDKAREAELKSLLPDLDNEDAETIAAIEEGIRQIEAGQGIPAEEARKRPSKWPTTSSTRRDH